VYCGSESAQVLGFELFPAEDGRLEYRQAVVVDPNPFGLKDGAPGGIAVEWVLAHPNGDFLYALVSPWDLAPSTCRVLSVSPSGEMGLHDEFCSTQGYQASAAVIEGDHLLIAHYLSGNVTILDLSDPGKPHPIQSAPMPDMRHGGAPRPHDEPFKAPFPHSDVKEQAPLCQALRYRQSATGW